MLSGFCDYWIVYNRLQRFQALQEVSHRIFVCAHSLHKYDYETLGLSYEENEVTEAWVHRTHLIVFED